MKLSDRLLTVASLLKEGMHVADVGADHGLIEKYLLDNDLVASIMAIENKNGPFNILQNNLKGYNVKLSLSDGIDEIDESVNALIIAGMGGNLIVDILKKHPDKLKNVEQIVVDAHRDIEYVRRQITELGYYIEKEKIVLENNIYYFVISFLKGQRHYSDIEYEYGYQIKDDELFDKYRENELDRMTLNLIHYKSSEKATEDGIKNREQKIRRLESL